MLHYLKNAILLSAEVLYSTQWLQNCRPWGLNYLLSPIRQQGGGALNVITWCNCHHTFARYYTGMCMCACSNSLQEACNVTLLFTPSQVYFYHQLLWQMSGRRQFVKDWIRQKKKSETKKNKEGAKNKFPHLPFVLDLLSATVRRWHWVEQSTAWVTQPASRGEFKMCVTNVVKVSEREL